MKEENRIVASKKKKKAFLFHSKLTQACWTAHKSKVSILERPSKDAGGCLSPRAGHSQHRRRWGNLSPVPEPGASNTNVPLDLVKWLYQLSPLRCSFTCRKISSNYYYAFLHPGVGEHFRFYLSLPLFITIIPLRDFLRVG